MSSICGVCRPDGAPVDGHEIEAMLDALDHWRADARGSWTGRGIGLGHLLLQATPQSRREALPAYDPEHELALTGDLRLDNRAELAGRLGIAAADLADWSDGRLVLRAYREWGEECPVHLLGDFAFVVWDGRRRQLFCARDAFGVKPFYYYQHGGTMAFASEMKGLLALPFVDRSVDETWIGDYLHRVTLDRVTTFYANIKRLAPAHALTLGADGMRTRRYWEPDPHRELHLARDEDYVDAFREKLVLAIRRRVETPFEVGAELSGGLDSSGICAIAHNLLRDTGRELHTFSQVLPEELRGDPGLPPDYRWAIDSLCRHAGITRTCFLAGEGGILSALEWVGRYHDEPPRDASSLYNHGLYDAAAASGVRVLLSGFGGNNCVSAGAEERRRELLWRGHWLELWRELSAGADRRHPLLAWLGLVRAELDGPRLHAIMKRGLRWQTYATRPTRDGFARRLGMRRRTFLTSLQETRRGTLRERAIHLLASPGVALRLEHANLPTAARRIEYRYPLLDVELVSLYLAMPSRLKYWRGTGRYLFRRSLEPWVPDDVRLASGPGSRASANPGNIVRKVRDQDALKARLRALSPDNPVFRYLDADKLAAQPRVPGRYPRERHSDMMMALALEQKLRGALLPPETEGSR